MRRFVPIICAVIVCCGVRAQAQQSDLAIILGGLAERTQQYYDRFISIICTETVHKQDLRTNLMPVGRPRTTVYELSVSRDSSGKDGRHVSRGANASIGERPPCEKRSGN